MRVSGARWAGAVTTAVFFLAAIGLVWPGVGPAWAAGGAAGAAKLKALPPLSGGLPNGHVGQEYGAQILGITGVDIINFHCDPDPVQLPDGLVLECSKMLIHGHPRAATADPTKPFEIKFTVADGKSSIQVNLTLTILDGPDQVTLTAAKPAKKPAAGAPAAAAANPSAPEQPPAPAPGAKKKVKAASAPVLEAAPVEERAVEVSPPEPAAIEHSEQPATASAPERPPVPPQGARIVPAVSVVSQGSAAETADPGGVAGAATAGGGYPPEHPHWREHGVGVEVHKETPVVEGAQEIDGRITNDSERISGLCVGLKQQDTTVRLGNGESYAAVTVPSGSKCPSAYAPVDPNTNEFALKLKEPLRAGVIYTFDVWMATTSEKVPVRGQHRYAISLYLPLPEIKVTSLIRDGVKEITGTCKDLPNPAVPTNATAKPPVTGNLPLVVVEVHEPDAPDGEWSTAQLSVGKGTAPSEEASASADGCTFDVKLNTPLTAGETVRVTLKAPAGRYFQVPGPDNTDVVWPDNADWNKGAEVFTALAVAPPVITSQIGEGITSITGTATPSTSTGTVTIAAISDDDYADKSYKAIPSATSKLLDACYSPEDMRKYSGRFLPLASGNSAATSKEGAFTVKLENPLADGQRFHLVEVLPARSKLTPVEADNCKTTITEVKGNLDWGRIHADFVGGVLISNDSTNSTVTSTTTSTTGTTNTTTSAGAGNFSQAHQFFALNVEKSWALPGCYLRVFSHGEAERDETGQLVLDDKGKPIVKDQCYDWGKGKLVQATRSQHYEPGFSTYFQTRLTAIPVSTVSTSSGSNAGTVSGSGGNLISSAQTARVEVGTYFPFFITRWEYDHKPNALFFAPLAKTGFDTVTGPSTVNTVAVGGATTQTQSFEQVYTYWSYGARIGHMELSRSESKAPETFSYLDIAIGPYSSLQSYICHSSFITTNTPTPGSSCSQYTQLTDPIDSRKRLYRFDIEGLLKIPKTLFYVGLNANIGQKTLGASQLDHGFAAPDDIRFLFGTKFDIASVLTKFKLGPQ